MRKVLNFYEPEKYREICGISAMKLIDLNLIPGSERSICRRREQATPSRESLHFAARQDSRCHDEWEKLLDRKNKKINWKCSSGNAREFRMQSELMLSGENQEEHKLLCLHGEFPDLN